MQDLGIVSNGHILTRELQGWASAFPSYMDKQVRMCAQEFVRDCIIEIDKMIYSQPAGEGYTRTKKLRKGHTMRKVGEGVYLVENLVPYAFYQHDGWTDAGGASHAGRPWMDTALANNEKKYEGILDKSVMDMWGK